MDPLVDVAVLVHYAALDLALPVPHSYSIIGHVVTHNAAVVFESSDLHSGLIPKFDAAVVYDLYFPQTGGLFESVPALHVCVGIQFSLLQSSGLVESAPVLHVCAGVQFSLPQFGVLFESAPALHVCADVQFSLPQSGGLFESDAVVYSSDGVGYIPGAYVEYVDDDAQLLSFGSKVVCESVCWLLPVL